jgi:hypothetical protein
MVAQRMELAVMVSLEELASLQDAVDERIENKRKLMIASKDKKERVAIADELRVATMVKAKLDVSFH